MMQSEFHWKKGILDSTFRIYAKNRQIGKLHEKAFTRTSKGEINDKVYTFITHGFLNQHTVITDIIENKTIGEIRFDNWMTKATLSINKKRYYWKNENIFNTRWRIYNAEGTEIKFISSATSGQIETNSDDTLLLLCGLFVKNYYVQISIVLFAALIPVWVSVIS
jgi:hypothetical protein